MPKNTIQLAAETVKLATGQPVDLEPERHGKKGTPHAVARGRFGGLKSVIVRKTKLPSSEIAHKAVQGGWEKQYRL